MLLLFYTICAILITDYITYGLSYQIKLNFRQEGSSDMTLEALRVHTNTEQIQTNSLDTVDSYFYEGAPEATASISRTGDIVVPHSPLQAQVEKVLDFDAQTIKAELMDVTGEVCLRVGRRAVDLAMGVQRADEVIGTPEEETIKVLSKILEEVSDQEEDASREMGSYLLQRERGETNMGFYSQSNVADLESRIEVSDGIVQALRSEKDREKSELIERHHEAVSVGFLRAVGEIATIYAEKAIDKKVLGEDLRPLTKQDYVEVENLVDPVRVKYESRMAELRAPAASEMMSLLKEERAELERVLSNFTLEKVVGVSLGERPSGRHNLHMSVYDA